MTKEELIENLKKIEAETGFDREQSHYDADELLLKYINDDEVSKAFNAIEKWYA